MMENEMRKLIDRVRNFSEKLNEQKDDSFKVTTSQLNKLNKKVKTKHSDINVGFTFYGKLQAKYTEIRQTDMDNYYYQLWNSIIANSKNFDNVYYSI